MNARHGPTCGRDRQTLDRLSTESRICVSTLGCRGERLLQTAGQHNLVPDSI